MPKNLKINILIPNFMRNNCLSGYFSIDYSLAKKLDFKIIFINYLNLFFNKILNFQ